MMLSELCISRSSVSVRGVVSPALVSLRMGSSAGQGLLWTFTELCHYDLCSSLFVL